MGTYSPQELKRVGKVQMGVMSPDFIVRGHVLRPSTATSCSDHLWQALATCQLWLARRNPTDCVLPLGRRRNCRS
jgi:hypothetical protein|eukprot:COSAG01_NODE_3872_length_5603_cov_43.003997_2_plen_75_part_00